MIKNAVQKPGKRILALALCVVMLFTLIPIAAMAADYDNHWAKSFIEDAKTRGWMNGYEDGTFRPDDSITRAEFAIMLWRALGEPSAHGSNPFTDVAGSAWYREAVTALYEAGIVTGVGDSKFAPNDTLTREMAFTMLARAFELLAEKADAYSTFSDAAQISSWARAAVSALTERGYIAGIGDNQCAPLKALTRGEMAKLLITVFNGEQGDNVPVTPDPDNKDLAISLSYSPTTSTSGNVTITVTVTGNANFIGYRASSSSATYTTTSGFSDITSTSKFTVSSSGWYAVCATDAAGNFVFKLIQITNITGSSGGGGGGGGGDTSVAVTGVTITGDAKVGETLTANVTPSDATNVTYQWYVSATNGNTGGTAITGATGNTYTIGAEHVGKYIYVIVNGDNSSTKTSTPTSAVAPATTPSINVNFISAVADGTAGSATTTKVTLTFSADIADLAASDITITAGTASATKGSLTRISTGVYELTLTGITASGTITVAVAKTGYTIATPSKTVTVVYYAAPVVTVTRTGPFGGAYTYAVSIDGQAPSEKYDLHIFSNGAWERNVGTNVSGATVSSLFEYQDDCKVIVVLESAANRSDIGTAITAFIGPEKINESYNPGGAGVFIGTVIS